ncbi:MAG: hypothetical protein H0W56_10675 [Acidothermales bacterium]|nr:hypothetical protein [Acidothermales bacterium]
MPGGSGAQAAVVGRARAVGWGLARSSPTRAARADALIWQSEARNRHDPPPSTEEVDRLRLDELAYRCPAAKVAGALLGVSGLPPVATDPDAPTTASSGPLSTSAEVFAHYRNRNADGVGLQLGAAPGGRTVVGVRGTPTAWSAFMAERAVVERRTFEGQVAVNRLHRDAGRPVAVSWQPPPASTRSSGPLYGREIDAAARRPERPGQATPGWLVWLVAPDEAGRTVAFKSRRLGAGVEVLASGLVPLFATRSDGWRIAADVPMSEPLPSWLVDALGGRWSKRAAA